MNHTVNEFETALLKMGVEIEKINLFKGNVHQVIGTLNGIKYKWDYAGNCSCSIYNVKKYNIKFVTIVDEGKIIKINKLTYKLKKRGWFCNRYVCNICDLKVECRKFEIEDLTKMCNLVDFGYYKLQKK